MAETERRMSKGFVTAASLSSEDIDAVDKSVSERWRSALGLVWKKTDALNQSPTVRAEEESATRGAGRMDSH